MADQRSSPKSKPLLLAPWILLEHVAALGTHSLGTRRLTCERSQVGRRGVYLSPRIILSHSHQAVKPVREARRGKRPQCKPELCLQPSHMILAYHIALGVAVLTGVRKHMSVQRTTTGIDLVSDGWRNGSIAPRIESAGLVASTSIEMTGIGTKGIEMTDIGRRSLIEKRKEAQWRVHLQRLEVWQPYWKGLTSRSND